MSAAEIVRKNWKAIRHSGNGVITAVASRDLSRARQFVTECQDEAPFLVPPRALGSYEELLKAGDIDGVYIPLPTGMRKEWVIRAAEAGKHVVCEKPCAVTLADLREMVAACRRNGVQFMDGVMFMHSPRLAKMRELLDDGTTVGEIKRISSAFTFNAGGEFLAANIRMRSELEPDGCVGDQGWYCIRFALWAMKWRRPVRVTGRMLAEVKHAGSAAPVPVEFSGELFFEGGVSSTFYCAFNTGLQFWANISGTRGYLRLPDFVVPYHGGETVFETGNPAMGFTGCDFNVEPHSQRWTVSEHSHSHSTAQETNLFRNFAAQVQSGQLNAEWPEISLLTQEVMETCVKSARAGSRVIELGAG